MSGLVWAAVGAVAAIVAVLLVRGGMFSRRRRGSGAGGSQLSLERPGNGSGDAVRVRLAANDLAAIRQDIQKLHVVRTDLHRVGDLLERLLEEVTDFRRTHLPPSAPSGGSARDGFREPVRDAFREPIRDTSSHASSIPGAAPRRDERDLRHEPRDAQFDPVLPDPAPIKPVWSAPAAAEPAGPPPDAVHVEASNDTVVSSARHPPEAWLVRTGGGGAEVYLNPRVPLTDPALQRWSTFFDWERREPGARYEATRPALVSSSGSVVRKGAARPA